MFKVHWKKPECWSHPFSILFFLRILASLLRLRRLLVTASVILGSSILIWASAYVSAAFRVQEQNCAVNGHWFQFVIRLVSVVIGFTRHIFTNYHYKCLNISKCTLDLMTLLAYLALTISASFVISHITEKANLEWNGVHISICTCIIKIQDI